MSLQIITKLFTSVQGYFYYDEVGPIENGNLPIHMAQRVTEQFDEYENDASQIQLLSQTLSRPNSSCTRAYENGLESALSQTSKHYMSEYFLEDRRSPGCQRSRESMSYEIKVVLIACPNTLLMHLIFLAL